jgi:hypothetical protein
LTDATAYFSFEASELELLSGISSNLSSNTSGGGFEISPSNIGDLLSREDFPPAVNPIKLLLLAVDSYLIEKPFNPDDYLLIPDEDYYPEDYTGYIYPVRPGMIEWLEFETGHERTVACQIPDETLQTMNTSDLAQSVIFYPLAVEALLLDTEEMGFLLLAKSFNGLEEILGRSNAVESLLDVIETYDIVETNEVSEATIATYLNNKGLIKK